MTRPFKLLDKHARPEQDDGQIALVFPDGFSAARIRTTSYHSVNNLLRAINLVKNITGGSFAGVPFELRLTNRQGVDGTGMKRTFPTWTFLMKPRNELRLTQGGVKAALMSGNRAAADLRLPPPREDTPADDATFAFVETPAHAEAEQGDPSIGESGSVDAVFTPISDEDVNSLAQNKDPEAMKRQWFALVKDTPLEDNESRAEFLARHVDGVSSLSEVVGLLRPEQFSELLVIAQDEIAEQAKAAAAALEKTKWHASITPFAAKVFVQAYNEAEIGRLELFPMLEMLTGHTFDGRGDIKVDDVGIFTNALGNFDDDDGWWLDVEKRDRLRRRFEKWVNSDESALGVL